MERGSRIGLILIFLMIIFSIIFISEESTLAQNNFLPKNPKPDVVVTLSLLESFKKAPVGPGDSGIVEFNGNVNVTLNNAKSVVVYLTVDDPWGTATIKPTTIEFSNSCKKPFIVNVTAPLGESRNTGGVIKVFCNLTTSPENLSFEINPKYGGLQGLIHMEQFYDFSVDIDKPVIKTEPGKEVKFNLIITNKGNGRDYFTIKVDNKNKLSDNGFKVKINLEKSEEWFEEIKDEEWIVGINEKQNVSVEIYVDTPSGIDRGGTYNIKINVTSALCFENRGLNPSQELILEVKLKDDGFLSNPWILGVIAGLVLFIILIIYLIGRKKRKK